jgi:uncharacterized small protein (DUF1192 family)
MTGELIARLRAPVPTVYDCKDAADALEAKDRRIAELEAEVADLNECLTLAHMDGFEKGRDAARAAYKDFANAG